MAISSAAGSAGALIAPAYAGQTLRHAHAKKGGGRMTHTHENAYPGHGHEGVLPTPRASEGKADVSAAQRASMAERGVAMADGSFPIPDVAHLKKAIMAFGRAKDKTATQAHIVKRARALGRMDLLPDAWREDDGKAAAPTTDFELSMDIKSVVETEAGDLVLTGYANTWATDRDDEHFVRQCFEDAIDGYMLNPILCLDHDRKRWLGTAMERPVLDDIGVRTRYLVPKPPEGTEPWHVKAFNDIKRGVLRALSVGGKFFRDGKSIIGMDWRETSVTAVASNPFSIFDVAEAKSLSFKASTTTALGNPRMPGVGRGHGFHRHGLGPRRGARHRHRNGVRHRHPGGRLAHTHRSRAGKGLGEITHAHPAGFPGHAHSEWAPAEQARLGVKADGDEGQGGPPDPRQEAGEIEERGELGALFQGLLEALSEVVDDDDMGDQDKVDNIAQIFEDFEAEAADILESEGGEIPDDEDGGKWALSLALNRGQREAADTIGRALAINREERTLMPSTTKPSEPVTPAEGGAVDPITAADLDDMKSMKARLDELEREKREAKMAQEAEQKAAELLELEAKEEADRKAAEEAEQKRLTDMVAQAMERQRATLTTGRTFVHGAGSTSPQHAAAPEKKNLGEWLKDLREARRGDGEAYLRIRDGHKRAQEAYSYDEKALNETAPSGGGFLVPPEYWQEGFAEYRIPAAPMRQLVPSHPVTTNLVYIPRATGISAVAWVAENAAKPSQDQTFGQVAVGVYAVAGISRVSNQSLDDSSPTIDSIVRMDLGRTVGQAEDLAILNGDGNGKPTGILQTSGITLLAIGTMKLWQGISAAMTTVASTFFGPARAVVAPPNMVGKLRDAVDSNNRPILQAGFIGNLTIQQNPYPNDPQMITPVGLIYGLPLYEDANMPANLGGGANETRVLVGDFSQCVHLDRQGVTIDVSNQAGTSWESNQTWFRGEARLGFTAGRQPTAICALTGLTPTAG